MTSLADRARQRNTTGIFSEDQVAYIKWRLDSGASPREIAQAHSCSTETIRKIGRGDTWAWVLPREFPQEPPAPVLTDEEIERSLASLKSKLDSEEEQ